MFEEDVESIATGGFLAESTDEIAGGYLLFIEEMDIPEAPEAPSPEYPESPAVPKKRGRGAAKLGLSKLVKVTVVYNGQRYIVAKKVKRDIKIATKDIEVKFNDKNIPEININVDGIKLNEEEIDNLTTNKI